MEIFTAVQGQSVRGSDIALSEMSSLEFASSWSLMNIVFSFHFVLPVFNAACLKRWPNSIGNYRILHVDWCFFLHGSGFSTIFEYFVICPFFFFLHLMNYLPGSHGNQSDEKKFCHFFGQISKVFGQNTSFGT